MRPPRLVVRAYVRRGAVVWLTARLLVGIVFAFGQANPFIGPPVVHFGLVALSSALTLVDVHRRHERILIGNLAIEPAFVVALAGIPALAGEIAIFLAAKALAA